MILVGQFDSPFVRRVGIALTLYGLAFEHRPWSVFGDADRIRPLNPLVRVPILVDEDGTVLTDSHVILDHLDGLVPEDRALVPRHGNARRDVLRITALATGLGEKAVALFYEIKLHETVSPVWAERCRGQILATAAALEKDLATRLGPFWFGDRLSHADIATASVLGFAGEAHPGLLAPGSHPALAALAARCEALPAFRKIRQSFAAPA